MLKELFIVGSNSHMKTIQISINGLGSGFQVKEIVLVLDCPFLQRVCAKIMGKVYMSSFCHLMGKLHCVAEKHRELRHGFHYEK